MIALLIIYIMSLPLAFFLLPGVIEEFGIQRNMLFTFLRVWLLTPIFVIHVITEKLLSHGNRKK
jgi:hypothetical protein